MANNVTEMKWFVAPYWKEMFLSIEGFPVWLSLVDVTGCLKDNIKIISLNRTLGSRVTCGVAHYYIKEESFFSLNICWTKVHFWGHLSPLFWTLCGPGFSKLSPTFLLSWTWRSSLVLHLPFSSIHQEWMNSRLTLQTSLMPNRGVQACVGSLPDIPDASRGGQAFDFCDVLIVSTLSEMTIFENLGSYPI